MFTIKKGKNFRRSLFIPWLITGAIVLFVVLAFSDMFTKESIFNQRMNSIAVNERSEKILVTQEHTTLDTTPGIPTVTFNITGILKVLLQGVLIPLFMLSTGLLLLSVLTGNSFSGWPRSLIAGVSGLLSMFVFAILALVFGAFSRNVSSYAAITIVLVISIIAWPKLKPLVWNKTDKQTKKVFVFLIAIYIGWLIMLPLSPYPALLSHGLGDTPAYCRVAANIVYGRGMMEDYFIGDFVNGKYGYLTNMSSLPVLVTAFFYFLFGTNGVSLYILQSFSGILTLCLIASFVGNGARSFTYWWAVFSFFVFLLHPLVHWHMGLGTISNMLALSTVIFVFCLLQGLQSRHTKMCILMISAASMLVIRPEGVLLFVSLLGVQVLKTLLWNNNRYSMRFMLKILVVAVLVIVIPYILLHKVDHLPVEMKNASLFYLKYDQNEKAFVLPFKSWSHINLKLNNYQLGGEYFASPINPQIGKEILAHPAAFSTYFIQDAYHVLANVGGYLINRNELQEHLIIVLAVFVSLSVLARGQRSIVIACILFIVSMPFLNAGATNRHYYSIIIVLTALLLRSIASLKKQSVPLLLSNNKFVFIIGLIITIVLLEFNFYTIYWARHSADNRNYLKPFGDLRIMTESNSVIASSYPQLITSMTGRNSIGGTSLTENLFQLKKRFRPDYILIDDFRKHIQGNYTLFVELLDEKKVTEKMFLLAAKGEPPQHIFRTALHRNGIDLIDWEAKMLEVEQFENGDFENPAVDGGLAPWVANGLHSFSRESSVVADGQYSLKVTTRDSGSKLGQFISDFEKYRGKTLVLRAMVRRENNALVSISINDGVSETLSSAQSELGRFQIVMLRKKISPAATQLGVFLNVDDANSVAYFDNVQFFEIKVIQEQALDYKIVHHVPEERYIILKRDHRNLTGDLPVGD